MLQRPDAATEQDGRQHDDGERSDSAGEHQATDRLVQHAVEMRDRRADIKDADRVAAAVEHRLIDRVVLGAEQHRRPLVGFAAAQDRLAGMIGGELGADRAIPVLLLQVGGAADELVGARIAHEDGRVAAHIGHRAIDDRVVLEARHRRHLDALDVVAVERDLGVGKCFSERERQRAQIDLDGGARALLERAGQRLVGGKDHAGGGQHDEAAGKQYGLGAELERQPRHGERQFEHESSPHMACNARNELPGA
jgi:hypothetical protein